MKRCPFCSKEIKDEAIKCKHCRKWLKKEDLPQISFIGNAVFNYIEFYYSTKHTPVDRYKCNNEHVLRLLKCLESKRIETAAIDLADNPDPFRQYIKASTGPNSEYHPIFGEVQGADYKEYFGKTIPALCCYKNFGDRAPVEVFPRMDIKLGRVYLIEEWLENFIGLYVGQELQRGATKAGDGAIGKDFQRQLRQNLSTTTGPDSSPGSAQLPPFQALHPRVDHEDENVAMNSQENIKDTIDLVQRTNWVRAITVFGAVITSFWLTGLIFNTQGFVAALACFIGLSLIYGIGFSPMFAVSASILCFSFNAVGIWLPTISYFFAVIMLYVDIRARKLLRTACEGPFAFRYMGIKMETEFERRACGKS